MDRGKGKGQKADKGGEGSKQREERSKNRKLIVELRRVAGRKSQQGEGGQE